jgi:gamma-D-glutamyl-L-lysine dipeptidyl-peptidase
MRDLQFMFQALAPLRAQASDAAEMVSQLLFGDVVECLARDRQWLQVRNTADGYTGWLDEKAVLPIDEAWLAEAEWRWVQDDVLVLRAKRAGATLPLRLSLGARLPRPTVGVRLEIADWSLEMSGFHVVPAPGAVAEQVIALSARYLGAPYLWGGKSLWGIDCSGLTQMVFAMAGIQLPRDAQDQAKLGKEVAFAERSAGDLAFFENASGKVHHVGIILPDGNIRHASGVVHDATLTEQGIIGKITGTQTHTLCSIKRFT